MRKGDEESASPDESLSPDVVQRSASNPAVSAWVSASAGSGKTKVLVDRVLRLLLTGTRPGAILCLTYTRAAAAEMAERLLHGTLARWVSMDEGELSLKLADLTGSAPTARMCQEARRLFARVLDAPDGGVRFLTLHSFCQSLLGRFPVEAGVPPHAAVVESAEQNWLMRQACEACFRAAGQEPNAPLADALDLLAGEFGENLRDELLPDMTASDGQLRDLLDAHGGLDGAIRAMRDFLGLRDGETSKSALQAFSSDAAFDAPSLRRAAACLVNDGSDAEKKRGRAILDWLEDPAKRVMGFPAYRKNFVTDKNTINARMTTKAVREKHPDVEAILVAEGQRLLDADDRRYALICGETSAALLILASQVQAEYTRRKRQRGLLDYGDLVHHAVRLLERPGIAPWVLYKLDGGLDHILLDEAQDTSPSQWRLLRSLTEDFFAGSGARDVARTIFAVGDPKQSIYSFQGADPQGFSDMHDYFKKRIEDAKAELASIPMRTSFRSHQVVLDTVDAVFSTPTALDGVAAEPLKHHVCAAHRGMAGRVEIWPLAREEDSQDQDDEDDAPVKSVQILTNRLADRIQAMLQDESLAARGRRIQPRDMMVLLRKREPMAGQLVRALKQRGVPVAGDDRVRLAEQGAVQDVLALLRFVLLPQDDMNLAAVLRGPLLSFDDDQLFELAYGRQASLWDRLHHSEKPWAESARVYLQSWLARADALPPFEFVAAVLEMPCPTAVSGRQALIECLGSQAIEALAELLTALLDEERLRPPSLQVMVQRLQQAQEEMRREAQRDANGPGEVRIMTVHGAKGLQAPIVILPDMHASSRKNARLLQGQDSHGRPLILIRRASDQMPKATQVFMDAAAKRDEQEYRRLLYVALTRAEECLVLAGWEQKRGGGASYETSWYDLCKKALAPIALSQEHPEGIVHILETEQTAPSLRGGPIRAQAMRQMDMAIPDWLRRPAPPEETPPRPLTPSRPDEDEPALLSPLDHGQASHSLLQRGQVVHRLLQWLPDMPAQKRAQACHDYLDAVVADWDSSWRHATAREVMAVLDSPEWAALFGPNSRAEVPVTGLLPGGRVLSGQIDRLCVTDQDVLIVDYKSQRRPPESPQDTPPAYLNQMRAYAQAMAAIYPKHRTRCFLLWTVGPCLMELPQELVQAG
ncbi:MAG: double-strand break repair helicase AddA [Alphaproteobacteria bacterium]|nr:MAG: double-strand break repair helicase AddA [Alphaproteobacteria bacterium]